MFIYMCVLCVYIIYIIDRISFFKQVPKTWLCCEKKGSEGTREEVSYRDTIIVTVVFLSIINYINLLQLTFIMILAYN